jgi:predicted tellurium resistance membrane protein TerC
VATKTQSVTSLGISPEQERKTRMVRYTIAMATRMVCVVLAVVLPYTFFTWIFWAGAIFLPYFAVVLANLQNGNADSKVSKAKAPTLVITADEFTVQDKPVRDNKDA